MIQKVTLVWCCRTECKNWSSNEFLVDIRMRTAEIVKNLVKRCWSRLSILYSREAKCVKIAFTFPHYSVIWQHTQSPEVMGGEGMNVLGQLVAR